MEIVQRLTDLKTIVYNIKHMYSNVVPRIKHH